MLTINGPDDFDAVADSLLNRYLLIINNQEWRITEIEFYYYSDEHPDGYTHKDTNQKKSNEWYFHRQNGGAFKGGTYKGLDISCGNGINYGGILIRSISRDNQLIEGPCNVVNKILEITCCDSISDLVTKITSNIFENGLLYLKETFDNKVEIMKGPRVGLTLKQNKQLDYIYKNYRYVTTCNVKKNKCTLVLSEFISNKNILDQRNLNRWLDLYNNGKTKTDTYFLSENPGISTVKVQCELLGFIHSKVQ